MKKPRLTVLAAFSLLFVGVGVAVVLRAQAAGPFAAIEAEMAALGNGASLGSGGGASGNSFVKFVTAAPPPPVGTATYPLKASPNKHYLVGQNNVAYLLTADTAWNLPTKLTLGEAIQYLDARKAQGFNTILASLVDISAGKTTSINNTRNRNGALLFNGGNIGAPNPAYFDHLDQLLAAARDRGMQLAIWPVWGQMADQHSSYTTANMAAYGQYLGNRYKNTDNLMWTMGGDWGNVRDVEEGRCPNVEKIRAMAGAIKGVDNRHMMTLHPGLGQSSTTCYNGDTWMDINSSYWDFNFTNLASVYQLVWGDYNRAPTRPSIMIETAYEGHGSTRGSNTTTREIRTEEAHQLLSGATGSTNGFVSTFEMLSGSPTWQQTIATRSGWHVGYIAAAFRNRAWWNLIPEVQNPATLTGSGGSSYGQQDHALASRTGDGSLVIAYAPTARTLTINMARLSGVATARWYDPTNGQYRAITGSPFANSGSRQFATPGNNSAGDGDWLLILETSPVN